MRLGDQALPWDLGEGRPCLKCCQLTPPGFRQPWGQEPSLGVLRKRGPADPGTCLALLILIRPTEKPLSSSTFGALPPPLTSGVSLQGVHYNLFFLGRAQTPDSRNLTLRPTSFSRFGVTVFANGKPMIQSFPSRTREDQQF